MEMSDYKQQLIDNLNIIFKYPYYKTPIGKREMDYIAFNEDFFYNDNSVPLKLEQLVQKIATSLIIKFYDQTQLGDFFQEEKANFKEDDGFTFLFDETCRWVIVHDNENDAILLIGKDLIECAKSLIPNWRENVIDWFNR